MSLLAELKGRKVFRVAGVYLVAGWVAVQVADTLVDLLELPVAIGQAIIVLAVAGFPVAIALAWAFDLTADGVERTAGSGKPVPRPALIAGLAGVVILSLAAGGWWLGRGGPPEAPPAATAAHGAAGDSALDPRSIAVLPFADMSPAGDQEYFSDGLAEELLNALAQLPELRVAARTSSFAFKGRNMPVEEIAGALKVTRILEGSVRKAGDRIRVTAQLIDAENGYHLWSETYDRDLADIFAVQDEITRAIVDALKVELDADAVAAAASVGTTDVDAHDLYLRAIQHVNRRTGESLREALELLRRATIEDPAYARAYAVEAQTRLLMIEYAGASPAETLEEAEVAARRALALAPDDARALVALAQIHYRRGSRSDVERAEQLFTRAIRSSRATRSPATGTRSCCATRAAGRRRTGSSWKRGRSIR